MAPCASQSIHAAIASAWRRESRPGIERPFGDRDEAELDLRGRSCRDLAEPVDDAAIGESCDQLLAIVRVLRARRQAGDGLGPEVLDERAAFRVGDRVRHRVEPLGMPVKARTSVRAVEEPELAVLPRLDVIDEAGAGTLPARPPGRELALPAPSR